MSDPVWVVRPKRKKLHALPGGYETGKRQPLPKSACGQYIHGAQQPIDLDLFDRCDLCREMVDGASVVAPGQTWRGRRKTTRKKPREILIHTVDGYRVTIVTERGYHQRWTTRAFRQVGPWALVPEE